MARAIIAKAKTIGRPPSGRALAARTSIVKQRGTPKVLAITASASKEELRARVEKLERANATLRVKNKELRIIAVEAAEQVDALTVQLQNSERRAGRQTRHEAPAEAVETREILRPALGKRKVRAAAGEHGHDGQDASGESANPGDRMTTIRRKPESRLGSRENVIATLGHVVSE